MANNKRTPESPDKLKKNPVEWTVFGFSLLLLLSLIGYLIIQSFSRPRETPDLKVSYAKDPSSHQPHRYKIILENMGGSTAEEVKIEAGLMNAGQLTESSELQVAFSPKKSKKEGWVNFSHAPTSGDSIIVRVVSYKKI